MTREDRKLLLKDLCARLPYGVIILDIPANHYGELLRIDIPSLACFYDGKEDEECQTLYNIKPYLRPMSSMTGVQVLEYISLKEEIVASDDITYSFETHESIDWLNSHHFDYRGLIEKGLALEVLEGMYK